LPASGALPVRAAAVVAGGRRQAAASEPHIATRRTETAARPPGSRQACQPAARRARRSSSAESWVCNVSGQPRRSRSVQLKGGVPDGDAAKGGNAPGMAPVPPAMDLPAATPTPAATGSTRLPCIRLFMISTLLRASINVITSVVGVASPAARSKCPQTLLPPALLGCPSSSWRSCLLIA